MNGHDSPGGMRVWDEAGKQDSGIIREMNAEVDALRSSLAIANAEAAKMREALNELISCGLSVPEPGDKRGMMALVNARSSLSSTAGRDLLARMARMRDALERIRDKYASTEQAGSIARAALAALDALK